MMRSQEERRVPAAVVRSVSFSYPDLSGSDSEGKIEKEGRSGAFLHEEKDAARKKGEGGRKAENDSANAGDERSENGAGGRNTGNGAESVNEEGWGKDGKDRNGVVGEPDRRVLRDISFDIAEGEIVVLTGFSGCGKSTLCNIIGGIIPNVIRGELTGSVELFGKDISGVPLYETAQTAGMVFQNVDLQMVCTTVEDELAFGLENLCVPPEEIRERVDEMMERMGLTPFRLRSPSSLSGGQKRLVAIAAVLILDPPILILDEPASHLDENGRKIVRETVLQLQQAGRTVIMVEHDLSLVDYADRWIVIRDGRIAEDASPEYFREHPEILEELDLR